MPHFDIGTHKEGAELNLLTQRWLPKKCRRFHAFGFEAAKESFAQVSRIFEINERVCLQHAALCHTPPPFAASSPSMISIR